MTLSITNPASGVIPIPPLPPSVLSLRSHYREPPILGHKILLVEEDLCIGDLIQVNLESSGSKDMVRAFDGIEGLQKAREHPDTEIIILDGQMPYLWGDDVAKVIRQSSTTPIILISGNNELRQNALAGFTFPPPTQFRKSAPEVTPIGLVDIAFDKPFNPKDLIDAVAQAYGIKGFLQDVSAALKTEKYAGEKDSYKRVLERQPATDDGLEEGEEKIRDAIQRASDQSISDPVNAYISTGTLLRAIIYNFRPDQNTHFINKGKQWGCFTRLWDEATSLRSQILQEQAKETSTIH